MCDRDADNDFVVDDDDACPDASGLDRDLDHDGCKDDLAALAAFVRAQIAEIEELADGNPAMLIRLRAALRKLLRLAVALDDGKVGAAIRRVPTSVKALLRAASRGVDVGHHTEEAVQVARVLSLLQIDQVGSDTRGATRSAWRPRRSRTLRDSSGSRQPVVEAVESFGLAARQVRKAV